MKKFYIGLPIVIAFGHIVLLAMVGFIWESIDVREFVFFAFITSLVIPMSIEIILIIAYCQYIIIDKEGVRKYLFGKKIVDYSWQNIKEILVDSTYVYISLEELKETKKKWNKKKYIYIMYSNKLIEEIKKYVSQNVKINF